MTVATINSYSPSSLFANPLASLLVFTSVSRYLQIKETICVLKLDVTEGIISLKIQHYQ
jgi:hypothetical protein